MCALCRTASSKSVLLSRVSSFLQQIVLEYFLVSSHALGTGDSKLNKIVKVFLLFAQLMIGNLKKF